MGRVIVTTDDFHMSIAPDGFQRADMTKCHKLGGLTNRNILFHTCRA